MSRLHSTRLATLLQAGALRLAHLLCLLPMLMGTVACGEPSASGTEGTPGDTTVTPSAAVPRNLILIVVDTLRSDHLGAYGGPVATPFIDSLAASGVLFERSYAHIPLTGPSHASFFTSGLPSDHGCVVNSQALDDANLTLAEILQDQGYGTTGIISLGVLSRRFGFAQGFDDYFEGFPLRWWKSGDEINQVLDSWIQRAQPTTPQFLLLHFSDPHTPYAPPDETYAAVAFLHDGQTLATLHTDARPTSFSLTLAPGPNDLRLDLKDGLDRAAYGCGRVLPSDRRVRVSFSDGSAFTKNKGGAPQFVTLPTAFRLINPTDAALSIDLNVTLRQNLGPEDWPVWYAKEVAYVDGQVRRATEALQAAGLWEDSIVVFTSDHGEGLGEHDLMQHVEQLYDSQLRIPLILRAPGLLPEGRRIASPVRHVDILPTVLELLGIDTEQFAASDITSGIPSDAPSDVPPDAPAGSTAGAGFRGQSLLPLIHGSLQARPPVLSETHTPEALNDQRSIVYQGFKYIVNDTSGADQLYALEDDPHELSDLSDQRPELVVKLRRAMDAEYARYRRAIQVDKQMEALSDEDRAQLEALGYVR
jgi:arylsulfatase